MNQSLHAQPSQPSTEACTAAAAYSDRAWCHGAVRLLRVVGTFLAAGIDYECRVRWRSAPDRKESARQQWMQRWARQLLRVLQVRIHAHGRMPESGLLVCNHLSYVDILVLASLRPAVFVAKSDVAGWPLIGGLARRAGTLFVRRDRRVDVGRLNREIDQVMRSGNLVALFPEGTSSGGATVLPFYSALLAPAVTDQGRITPACLHYRLAQGTVADEVCYWGEMTLLPHLFQLLRKRGLEACVHFGSSRPASADRKLLARQLHADVLELHGHCLAFRDHAPLPTSVRPSAST